MQVTGKQISAVVETFVNVKGLRKYSDKLLHGGRSVKFVAAKATEEQMKQIKDTLQKEFATAKVTVYETELSDDMPWSITGVPLAALYIGLRVRVSFAK